MPRYRVMVADDYGDYFPSDFGEFEAEDAYQALDEFEAWLLERMKEQGWKQEGDILTDECGCAFLLDLVTNDPPTLELSLYQPCENNIDQVLDPDIETEGLSYEEKLEKYYQQSELWGPAERWWYEVREVKEGR